MRYLFVCIAALLISPVSLAEQPFALTVEGLHPNQPIAEEYALCQATEEGQSAPGKNRRPTLRWNGTPEGTKSFALTLTDPDVPVDFTDAGKPGVVLEESAPRQVFYHWALADIPAKQSKIKGGAAPLQLGVALPSDLGSYVKDARQYGGPCPPFNDARLHHYHFTLYALDVASLGVTPETSAKELGDLLANSTHVLGQTSVVGVYTLNPDVHY